MTTGLRTATIVLMWLAAGCQLLVAVAAYSRWHASDVSQVVWGSPTMDQRGDYLRTTLVVAVALTLATAIVLAAWSHRAASNAQRQGLAVSPGLAAGGWFIPIGWYFVGFMQLYRTMAGRGNRAAVGWWQGLWIAGMVVSGLGLQLFAVNGDESQQQISDTLRNQTVFISIGAVLLSCSVPFAMRGLRSIDEVTSGRGGGWFPAPGLQR